MSFSIIFYIYLFLLTSNAYSNIQAVTALPISKKPLVLQWEVSHPRNTDQISLIFKQNYVELVTNTSSYQRGETIRLGWFRIFNDLELELLKTQIDQYYIQLKNSVSLSSFISQDLQIFPNTVDPHASILRINEKTVHSAHPYFRPAAEIIHTAWDKRWICVQCATYKKKKNTIIRTVKTFQSEFNKTTGNKIERQWIKKRQSFSTKSLNCIPKGTGKVECIDPQFGIFKI